MRKAKAFGAPPPRAATDSINRRRQVRGRRKWDLPPNWTRVLIAWSIVWPSMAAAYVELWR